jgi:glycosyltransferase involved in cell wall biosynthesis
VRIAIVGPTHPIKGGVAQHTTVLAQQLAAAGHDVRIVSWQEQYPQRLYPGQQTVERREFSLFEPTERVLSWKRPDSWVRAAFALRPLDLVVFAHVTPVQVAPYRVMLAALHRGTAQTVVICHNVLPHERHRGDRRLVASLLGASGRVVVHTATEAALARSLTTRPVLVLPIAPFLPDGFVPSVPGPGEHRRLLFFGLVRPYKGLDVLLEALARGPDDVRLRVVGEFWGGPEETAELCRRLGLQDRVDLRSGYLPADEVPRMFEDVDALVLPYRSVSGSQGVWTGFQFGVPVIATQVGHLSDDIRDGVNGMIAEPDDVESLASVLRRFYAPGLPERMRANVKPVDPQPYWDRYVTGLTASLRPGAPAEASGRR